MDLTPIFETLKAAGVDPALFGPAVLLAIVIRGARGTMRWFTAEVGYLFSIALGGVGAWATSAEGAKPKEVVLTSLALIATVLLVQKGLELAATKVPFLPRDNEWSKTKEEAKP